MMPSMRYYRGGGSLKPRSIDMVVDPSTGLLRTNRGVSVQDSPTGLDRFGGPFEVTNVPPELHIVKVVSRAGHYEIAPALPMTQDEYEQALSRIVLIPVTP
jgi:hypothetical protein